MGKLEPLGHHADQNGRPVVQPNRAADNLGVAAIAAHPEAMRQDRRAGGAVDIVLRQEVATEHGRGAQQPEGVMRDIGPENELGGGLVVADVEPDRKHRGDAVEGLARAAPVLEVGKRDTRRSPQLVTRPERHDAPVIVTGEPREQDGVDDGVHGRGQRHADSQDQDDAEGEPALLDQQPPGKADVLQHALQPWCDPDVAHVVAGERQVAQRAPGRRGRRGPVEPARFQLPLFHLQVEPQLVVELAFVTIALKQVAEALEQPGHAESPASLFLPIV